MSEVQDVFPCLRGKSLIDVNGSTGLHVLVAMPASQKDEGVTICESGSLKSETMQVKAPDSIGAATASADGRKIAYTVFSSDLSLNGSVWVYDVVSHQRRQLLQGSASGAWNSYPKWGEDSTALLVIKARRTEGGLNTSAVLFSITPDGSRIQYELPLVVSADIPKKSGYILVAWSKDGLVGVRRDGLVDVLVANQWRGGKWLVANTLVAVDDGKTLAFTTYDPTREESALFELDVYTRSITEVYAVRGRVMSLYRA